jgi:hypothetical protein
MAPEEFRRGATIDQRSTVYTLGRTAFVLLSLGRKGEQDEDLWRAGPELLAVARRAVQPAPAARYQTVAALAQAWQAPAACRGQPGLR